MIYMKIKDNTIIEDIIYWQRDLGCETPEEVIKKFITAQREGSCYVNKEAREDIEQAERELENGNYTKYDMDTFVEEFGLNDLPETPKELEISDTIIEDVKEYYDNLTIEDILDTLIYSVGERLTPARDIVVIDRKLYNDILHKLHVTHNLQCTDRPDIIPKELDEYFFTLDNTNAIDRLEDR